MIVETNARLELKAKAADLSERHKGRSAQAVLKEVITTTFEGRVGLVSSFGTRGSDPAAHGVAHRPLRAGHLFGHMETLSGNAGISGHTGAAARSVEHPDGHTRPDALKADDPDGLLHQRNPDLCCHVRKSVPMLKSLRSLSCWITGRKRQQAATRSDMTLFEIQDRWIKVNPLIDWAPEDVDSYFAEHDLPRHPLQAQGYPSIGCAACTKPVAPGDDARAGRWADSDKTECGIHFENGKMVRASRPKN